jgi:hypothetical protein
MNLMTLPFAKKDVLIENQIHSLYNAAKDYPHIQCEEKHHFGPNLYIKEVTMPSGSVIVGKHHKIDHLCNMVTGRMIIVNPDGTRHELIAPMTFMAKPGRKIAYIIETVVFQNIYSTDETDIEKLENMFIDNSKNLLEEGN